MFEINSLKSEGDFIPISYDIHNIEAKKDANGVLEVPIPANTRPTTKCPAIEVNYFVNIYINDKSSGIECNFPVIIRHSNNCTEED